ncbi:RagB/SusD family nutrient uptake outer membrane protein [Flavobacterium pallidum]|uniref:RagB/SusD family nutrient uptake outer membrane protein n=1 Tax=Flavobacterium pallidum TaxID=2172098 RepID=A0A2S1SGD1_9FLAO|nr:RagB/SusD family nutrient uptake outer membrane protein [Flavobacterium pallidum]AWI25445.1 RagB/SusD family nutrient uptake outer membrane protein [Flavobacterium pallidum]
MKKYLNLFLFTGLLILANSCTNDLDVKPQDDDEFVADEFYMKPGAYKQALAGVYGNLALTGSGDAGSSNISGLDAGTSQYGRCLWYMQDLTTDEVVWSYESDPGTSEINRVTWSSTNPIFRGMFSRACFEVTLANEFLRQSSAEKLTARNISEAEKAEIVHYRAEARLLRALAYYHLMDLFGKAPFVTENDPISTTFKPQQYDRQQLFTFIESELLAINADLKDPKTNEYGRADKAVAWMILAKIYLNAEVYIGQSKYVECLAKCDEIIGAGYTLATNYKNNFNADNDSNEAYQKELIFTIQSDGQLTQNYGPTTVIINGEVGSIENNGSSLGVNGWSGALRTRKQFVQKFAGAEFNNDVRNTLIKTGRTMDVVDIAEKKNGYIITKFSNLTSTGANGKDKGFVDTDFPLFRLGDVYLMYAEAQMRRDGATNGSGTTNASTQSVDYINALRTRANGQTVSSGSINLQFILDERLRELHWEAHRRQDLIRFGQYTGGVYNWDWKGNSRSGSAIPAHYNVFPVPTASINANSNLTQNPNY